MCRRVRVCMLCFDVCVRVLVSSCTCVSMYARTDVQMTAHIYNIHTPTHARLPTHTPMTGHASALCAGSYRPVLYTGRAVPAVRYNAIRTCIRGCLGPLSAV